ncbi:hypothetical protein HDV57DRAFT_301970 [Trichoderma longibrachiatum]
MEEERQGSCSHTWENHEKREEEKRKRAGTRRRRRLSLNMNGLGLVYGVDGCTASGTSTINSLQACKDPGTIRWPGPLSQSVPHSFAISFLFILSGFHLPAAKRSPPRTFHLSKTRPGHGWLRPCGCLDLVLQALRLEGWGGITVGSARKMGTAAR